MKAMILAAGKGERMRPLTEHTPKPLLQVGGQCLIEYHIQALRRAGIKEIVINVSWLGERIQHYLGDGERYGVQLAYSVEKPEPLETAGGIIAALPLLGISPFLLVNGDIWTDYPLEQLGKVPAGLAHIVLVANPVHHPKGDFALESGTVRTTGSPRFTYSGIGVYDPRLFAGLASGIRPLAPLLREAIDRGEISGEVYSGQWWDVGTPQRLSELDALLRAESGNI